MTRETYEIVEHADGWAYRANGSFSETFATREQARAAAERAAREQRAPGDDVEIEYEDAQGNWRVEHSPGGDRPTTDVKD